MPSTPDQATAALLRADELSRRPPPPVPPALLAALCDGLGADPVRADGRLRRVPSAGALHPVVIFLRHRSAHGIEIQRWDCRTQEDPALVHPPNGPGTPEDPPHGIDVAFVTKPDRTVTKYGDRALPQVLLDTGYALSAFAHAAAAHGLYLTRAGRFRLDEVDGVMLAAVCAAGRAAPDDDSEQQGADCAGTAGAYPGVVPGALRALAPYPQPPPDPGGAVPLRAIRSRRSAPFDRITGPVPSAAVAEILAQLCLSGDPPPGIEIWLATPGDAHQWRRGRWVPCAAYDHWPELAASAAGQHELTGVGALILFTARTAAALGPQRFLATRFAAAHLGYGLCVRAASASLGARPVGGWTAPDPARRWGADGVVVHGVALGTMPDHGPERPVPDQETAG